MSAGNSDVMLKVQSILREDSEIRITRDGVVKITVYGIEVDVVVEPHPGGRATVVRVSVPILRSMPATPALNEYIAFEGHQGWVFGRLSLATTDDGTCELSASHVLLGDFLDADELKYVVHGMARSVETGDDSLLSRFGGELVHAEP